ncbi:helix-turn-helix domain-containing protein [Paraburkholderia phosphatilytica]|uniref:helix-turn-helix domain-containing protein n=1 Tax=Paraburkholderia phosphatilytica TaxID=2282883 RepID=UPI0013E06DC5|nr:helix-turn-helix domain-containing protein [Paraburkholderia phosphatilytica]
MPIQVYTTDTVAVHERFDYWREALCRNFFGMTADLPRPERDGFCGCIRTKALGDSALTHLTSRRYLGRRRELDVEDAPGHSLFLYLQRSGSAWFDTPDKGRIVTETNDLAMAHSDLPFVTGPQGGQHFDFQILTIPFSRVQTVSHAHGAPPLVLDQQRGIGPLLRTYLEAFIREADHLDGLALDVALQTLANLAAVAYGNVAAEDDTGRDAIRRARHQRVLDFIEQHLQRPDLSPGFAAGALGMSVRQLHALFESTGTTFARRVRSRRLARARAMVMQDRDAKITSIAFACGFESLTTFHRAFHAEFGMSPLEMRHSIGREFRVSREHGVVTIDE